MLFLLFSDKARGGQIALAGVGQKGHDGLAAVFRALCQLQRSVDGRAGGDAYQDALTYLTELQNEKSA